MDRDHIGTAANGLEGYIAAVIDQLGDKTKARTIGGCMRAKDTCIRLMTRLSHKDWRPGRTRNAWSRRNLD